MSHKTVNIEGSAIWKQGRTYSANELADALRKSVKRNGMSDKGMTIKYDQGIFSIEGDELPKTEYIYLIEQGISIGVRIAEGKAYLAASFVNFDTDPATGKPDAFSRPAARRRIDGRIDRVLGGSTHRLVLALPVAEGHDEYIISNRLREVFKPDNLEAVEPFVVKIPDPLMGDISFRRLRTPAKGLDKDPSASEWEIICEAFRKACV